jgi:hypothetical protein
MPSRKSFVRYTLYDSGASRIYGRTSATTKESCPSINQINELCDSLTKEPSVANRTDEAHTRKATIRVLVPRVSKLLGGKYRS